MMQQDADTQINPIGASGSLHTSDVLLAAVTKAISGLLKAASIKEALPAALESIAQVIQLDRMVVIAPKSDRKARGSDDVYFVWQAADAPNVDPVAIISGMVDKGAIEKWMEPVYRGEMVTGLLRTSTGALRELLTQLGVVSVLIVPIAVDGRNWGHIAFDDCKSEREWTGTEANALKIFAEVVGTAVTRERFVVGLRQRDHLLAAVTDSALDITTAPYLHEAILRSLEKVAKAVGADRMFLMEMARAASGARQVLMHSAWHAPATRTDLESVLKAFAGPLSREVESWLQPLLQGQAVAGSINDAAGARAEFLGRLGAISILVVPVTVDGRFWGQISFDDCHSPREWTVTEIEILKTLAQLIGTAITRERYVEELGKANMIVQNSPTILYRLRGDPSFPMIYVSQNVALLGYQSSELLNSPTLYQSHIHPEDRAKVQGTLVAMLRTDAAPITIEHRMLNSAGATRWMENRFTPVRDDKRRLMEVEGMMVDITERRIAEERIAVLARTDALTGLANRATFEERLRLHFAASRRGADSFAVLYLDLDRFKEVNDTRGHPVGDKLLQAVAERIRKATRETDLVARLGGDEFAVLQAGLADPGAAGVLAGKIIETVSAPYTINGHEVLVGTSVGISCMDRNLAEPDHLLVQADQALYRSKREGRGEYRFYSEELDREAHQQVTIADELRKALNQNELELYYQPQVELTSGRVVGMEALIRWNHPTRGLLLPDAFLPSAEKAGIAQPLGRWVLEGACRQLAKWRADGASVPVVAVNVALAQIKTGREFVRDVRESLSRHGLEPSDLELDVTEFILARTRLAQSDVLEELQRMGVCIAIDDFGAQYSSLEYLRTYRVGRLKIARSMVAAVDDVTGGGSTMIRAIMSLANEMGVEVVAEGVETEEQRAMLVKMSATKGQGFYFSKPMPAKDTTEILRLAGATGVGQPERVRSLEADPDVPPAQRVASIP